MELLIPESGLIIWQLILFLVVLFVLSKFVWKPIINGIKQRETSIAESLESAEKAREEMQNLKADNEKLIQEARLERDKMLKEAKESANGMIEEARDKAKKEGAKLIEDAKKAIDNEKQLALSQVKEEAANLSVQIAEKILRTQLKDEKEQKALVTEYMKEANLN